MLTMANNGGSIKSQVASIQILKGKKKLTVSWHTPNRVNIK